MNTNHSKAISALDLITVSGEQGDKHISCLSLNDFTFSHMPFIAGATPQVALLHKSDIPDNASTDDAHLLLDVGDLKEANKFLFAIVRSAVYSHMGVTEDDPGLNELIQELLDNYNISISNIVATVLNAAGA